VGSVPRAPLRKGKEAQTTHVNATTLSRLRRRRRAHGHRGSRRAAVAAAGIAAALSVALPARAASKIWIGPSGNWSTKVDWAPEGQPASGDSATLTNGTNSVVLVTYDASATATNLAALTIDATNAGAISLSQAQGNLTVNGAEIIGLNGSGALNLSGGGTHHVTLGGVNGLYLGFGGGASGTVNLFAAGVLNVSAGEEFVGYSGKGMFNQAAGSNTCVFLTMGYNASGNGFGTNIGSGAYVMNGGTLNVAGEYAGWYGNGSFSQSAGVHTITSVLYVGANANSGTNAASSGTFTLSSGLLSASNATEYVGSFGSGTFNHSGGTHDAGTLYIAQEAGSAGVYNMSNAAALNVSGVEYVGYGGNGVFNQTGGTHASTGTNAGFLYLGSLAGGSGTYNLSGGSLDLSSGKIYVGYNGHGVFHQTGGTNSGDVDLHIGENAASSGTYTLDLGNLALGLGAIIAGVNGTGVYTQTDGSASAASLSAGLLAYSGGGTTRSEGIINLNGGTLTVQFNLGGTQIGVGGNGTFNHNAGTHTTPSLILGVNANNGTNFGGRGFYSLDGAASILNVTGNETIGQGGFGDFFHFGGSHTVAGNLVIADQQDSGGFYHLEAATASLSVLGDETVGNFTLGVGALGGATFIQHAGSHTIGGGTHVSSLYVARQAGGVGYYELDNGTLTTAGSEYFGYNGSGSYFQAGGTHQVNATGFPVGLFFGFNLGASGAGMLQGGTLQVASEESIGFRGIGTFAQSGGSNSAATLLLGDQPSGSGTYTLSGGTLTTSFTYVGQAGRGTMWQSGGAHTAADLYVGYAGTGTYGMTSGALVVLDSVVIGALGTGSGVFNQSGGTTTAGTVYSGYFTGTSAASGTANLSGGVLTTLANGGIAGSFVGYFGNGTFNHSGGTHNANGLIVGYNVGSTNPAGLSVYNMSNGAALNLNKDETVGDGASGVFNQSGGAHSFISTSLGSVALYIGAGSAGNGTFNLSGGTLSLPTRTTYVGYNGGHGSFWQSGGTHITGALNIAFGAGTSGIYTMTNGTLTVIGNTVNQGTINQLGGTSHLTAVSGSNGLLQVGNTGGALATMNVTSFQQSQVLIRNTGTLLVSSNGARVTNTATTFTIQGNGTLDLTDNNLLTSTAASTIRSYLINAYSPSQDWSGPGGLTSSLARANAAKFTVGYADGSDQSAQDAGINVAPGKVLVAPLLVGDANMDGTVDFFDITQVLGYKYNTGQPASYTDGDLNYDGVVDFFDLATLLSANYNTGEVFPAAAAAAAAAADGRPASPTTVPEPATGTFVLIAGGAAALLSRRRRRHRHAHCFFLASPRRGG
jgi:hypothetical protein